MKKTTTPSAKTKDIHTPLDTSSTYQIQGRTFVVQPVCQKEGNTTLAALLLNLMQADASFK